MTDPERSRAGLRAAAIPAGKEIRRPPGSLTSGVYPTVAWPAGRPVTTIERTFAVRGQDGPAQWVTGSLTARGKVAPGSTGELGEGTAIGGQR
jgi:hypothetical protein